MVHSSSVLAAGMFVNPTARTTTRMLTPAPASTQPWWAGFEDASMNRLMTASRGTATPGVAAAYIALKVKTLELVYLENTRAAVVRQTALLQGSTLAHDDFAKQLAARETGADHTIATLKAQRTSYIAYLAAQCQLSEAALNALLADALQDKSLPRFAAEVPRELPMAVLANRSDIHLAAALYDADAGTLPEGTISGGTADATNATDEAPDIDMPAQPQYAQSAEYVQYAQVVTQARDQVAGALRHLQMQSDIANTAYARVADARADFEAAKQRHDRGEISELQLMEDFQGLLLDLHVLAAANGELAMAWVVFMGSIGNDASIDASIDAMASAQDAPATQFPFLHKVSRKLRNP